MITPTNDATIETHIESIADALNQINDSLSSISTILSSTNIWDSLWFSAMIGAGAAIAVFSTEKYFSWKKRHNKDLLEYCKWLNEQWIFRAPDGLLDAARSTTYGHEERNTTTGERKVTPEKPLGEKMVIELRRDLKWWREPNYWLRRIFKKYEKELQKFDVLENEDKEEEKRLLASAAVYFEKIDRYAYKITGDNEDTAV